MWVIKVTTSYDNGFVATDYYSGVMLGFVEMSNIDKAAKFKTKKEAISAAKVIRATKHRTVEIEKRG